MAFKFFRTHARIWWRALPPSVTSADGMSWNSPCGVPFVITISRGARMLAGPISISESGADFYKGMYEVADGVEDDPQGGTPADQERRGHHQAGSYRCGAGGRRRPGRNAFQCGRNPRGRGRSGEVRQRVAAHAHGIDGIAKPCHPESTRSSTVRSYTKGRM